MFCLNLLRMTNSSTLWNRAPPATSTLFAVKYPYDYMDNVGRFDETALPSQEAFFNKLSGSSCSDADYAHATRVWDAFGCETIADDVYLQLDVLLLADFFEKISRTCLDFYNLDPCMRCCTSYIAYRSRTYN